MKRSLLGLFLVAALVPGPVEAQDKELPPGAELIRLTLAPTPAPTPALKYRLLPELRDQKTGNAVVLYYRAFAPEWQVQRHLEPAKKAFEKWSENTRQAPPKELHWLHGAGGLKQLDLGARRSHADWEMLEALRQEGVFLMLADIQGFRDQMRMLSARARLETAEAKFDKTLYTLQTGYKFSHDVCDAPTLIQSLVGMALAAQMFEQTEELIQAPGSPNLYWALTELPRPFVRMQKPYQGEKVWLDNLFPGLRDMLADRDARPLSEDQVRAIVDKLAINWPALEGSSAPSGIGTRLGLGVMAARGYPEAKRFLLAQGRKKDVVESMPVLQAYLLFEMHNYDRFYDEMIKWSTLPYPEAHKGMTEAVARLKDAKASGALGTLMATLLLPAAEKVQQASARTDRRIAALRIIEALRLHAASHDGKLPATLADVKEVPIPLDPMTGGPFQYRLEDGRARLSTLAPPGETPGGHNTLHYELTLKRE